MLDFDDIRVYEAIIDAGDPYGVGPSMSIQSEDFFRQMLKNYDGSKDDASLREWLVGQIRLAFQSIGQPPRWIQGAQWPIRDGKPLVFVGQLDIARGKSPLAQELFHDDTSYFVFIPRERGDAEVIMQQF